MQYIKTEKLTQKMQVLCGLQGIFLIFNCQTPVHCFTDTLANIQDRYCGGSPQLVGLIRKPLTYGISFGIISEKRRYYLGMQIPNNACFTNVEWRNNLFEICDGGTKNIKEGAAHQPNPLLKK